MAAITELGTRAWSTLSTDPKSLAATPAVGDVIVIVVAYTGYTGVQAPTDDNADGKGTYTLITSATKVSGADTMRAFVRNSPIGSATSTTFSHANGGASTGGGLAVFKITGMSTPLRFGKFAVRQSAVENDIASGNTPTPVLPVAALTTNPLLGMLFNGNSAATVTPRGTPVWTEIFDIGYSTPTSGLEAMSINSGETGTSIAWGSTSVAAFADIVLEFDSTAMPPWAESAQEDTPRARPNRVDDQPPNLVIRRVTSAALPPGARVADERPNKYRPARYDEPILNVVLRNIPPAATPVQRAPYLGDQRPPRFYREDFFQQNTTLRLPAGVAAPPFVAAPLADAVRRLQPQPDDPPPNLILRAPTAVAAPFVARPDADTGRRTRPQPDDLPPNLILRAPAAPAQTPFAGWDDDSRKPRANIELGWEDDTRLVIATDPPLTNNNTPTVQSPKRRETDLPQRNLLLTLPPFVPGLLQLPFRGPLDDDFPITPRPNRESVWIDGLRLLTTDIIPPPPSEEQDVKRQLHRDVDVPPVNLLLLLPPVAIPPPPFTARPTDTPTVRAAIHRDLDLPQRNLLLTLPPAPTVKPFVGLNDGNRTPTPNRSQSWLDETTFLNVTSLDSPFVSVSFDDPRKPRPNRDTGWMDSLRVLPDDLPPGVVSMDDARRRLRPSDEPIINVTLRLAPPVFVPPGVAHADDETRRQKHPAEEPIPPNLAARDNVQGPPPPTLPKQYDQWKPPKTQAEDQQARNALLFGPPPGPPTVPQQHDQWLPPKKQAEDQQQRNLLLLRPPVIIFPPQRADDWSVVRPPLNNRRSEHQENNIVFLLDSIPPVIPPSIGPAGGSRRTRGNTARKLLPMDQTQPDAAAAFDLSESDMTIILTVIASIEEQENY
jgi:hypothetical protein